MVYRRYKRSTKKYPRRRRRVTRGRRFGRRGAPKRANVTRFRKSSSNSYSRGRSGAAISITPNMSFFPQFMKVKVKSFSAVKPLATAATAHESVFTLGRPTAANDIYGGMCSRLVWGRYYAKYRILGVRFHCDLQRHQTAAITYPFIASLQPYEDGAVISTAASLDTMPEIRCARRATYKGSSTAQTARVRMSRYFSLKDNWPSMTRPVLQQDSQFTGAITVNTNTLVAPAVVGIQWKLNLVDDAQAQQFAASPVYATYSYDWDIEFFDRINL